MLVRQYESRKANLLATKLAYCPRATPTGVTVDDGIRLDSDGNALVLPSTKATLDVETVCKNAVNIPTSLDKVPENGSGISGRSDSLVSAGSVPINSGIAASLNADRSDCASVVLGNPDISDVR
jgi:hypothetical protein